MVNCRVTVAGRAVQLNALAYARAARDVNPEGVKYEPFVQRSPTDFQFHLESPPKLLPPSLIRFVICFGPFAGSK